MMVVLMTGILSWLLVSWHGIVGGEERIEECGVVKLAKLEHTLLLWMHD